MSKRKTHSRRRGNQNPVRQAAGNNGCILITKEEQARNRANAEIAKKAQYLERIRKLCGLDGYSNSAVSIGRASPLISSGGFIRSNLTGNPEHLTTAYRECWLATRIIDSLAEDMTRAWYTPKGDLRPEDVEELRCLEARHSIKQELANALRWAFLYGGSIAVMVIYGEEERLDKRLNPDRIWPGSFAGLLVLDRTRVAPSIELETNLDDPDYGLPKYYEIETDEGLLRFHHSRVLRFIGRELPQGETERENYWGASELEHIWDVLMNHSSVTANIAELVFKANLSVLKIDSLGEFMSLGTEEAKAKTELMFSTMIHMISSFGMMLLNPDESLETHPYSFAGLKEIHEAMMTEVAGAAEIPATKLFGRSPDGMNATGEADMRNYYERIAGLQDRMLRPALERLLPVMALSCFGFQPEEVEFIFNPLATLTPEQTEELAGKATERIIAALNAGIITRDEARAEMKTCGESYAAWSMLDTARKEHSHEKE